MEDTLEKFKCCVLKELKCGIIPRCQAKNKTTGKRCNRNATNEEKTLCKQHVGYVLHKRIVKEVEYHNHLPFEEPISCPVCKKNNAYNNEERCYGMLKTIRTKDGSDGNCIASGDI